MTAFRNHLARYREKRAHVAQSFAQFDLFTCTLAILSFTRPPMYVRCAVTPAWPSCGGGGGGGELRTRSHGCATMRHDIAANETKLVVPQRVVLAVFANDGHRLVTCGMGHSAL
ncbi:uncharacterized protein ColSpa_06890 [Colletotrichum spaethianum]|uniref:Uncharacterized protein n=1 Tax=Colletotrichum spaethianum TaxID=700344 RepID=A0AA37LI50_9PEZI|nr:uncharacterized protein ColSpa_06890 [Colletotrichum spaethianum]GKT46709.1 hypothetical protein ColSpa_06890 [Colletotrichum spaethianum]